MPTPAKSLILRSSSFNSAIAFQRVLAWDDMEMTWGPLRMEANLQVGGPTGGSLGLLCPRGYSRSDRAAERGDSGEEAMDSLGPIVWQAPQVAGGW